MYEQGDRPNAGRRWVTHRSHLGKSVAVDHVSVDNMLLVGYGDLKYVCLCVFFYVTSGVLLESVGAGGGEVASSAGLDQPGVS